MDSGFHAGDSGFQILNSSLCQWNLDSKAQDFGFHKQKFPFHEAKDTLTDAAGLNGPGLKEKPLIPSRFDRVH